MKILTWNINGLRSFKGPLIKLFDSLDADVICLQETKITRPELTSQYANVEGYNSYFSFSNKRSGYSGVATYVRDSAMPHKYEEGITGLLGTGDDDLDIGCYGDLTLFTNDELKELDAEGRVLLTQHKVQSCCTKSSSCLLTIINLYCPRVACDRDDRRSFKSSFCRLLEQRVRTLISNGSHVAFVGDFNIAHKALDHGDPTEEDVVKKFEKDRIWFDNFIVECTSSTLDSTNNNKDCGTRDTEAFRHGKLTKIGGGCVVDTFRYFHPRQEGAFTCWCTMTGARATNYGARLDYILADRTLTEQSCQDCVLLQDVMGSDHCPVRATFDCHPILPDKCPPGCTRNWPEFVGKQKKMMDFFGKSPTKTNQASIGSENGSQKNSLKRTASEPLVDNAKKKKGAGQTTLAGFFGVPKKQISTSSAQINKIFSSNTLTAQAPPPSTSSTNQKVASSWKSLLSGPGKAPMCQGHREPCVLRTVKKEGSNQGRQFYVCNRPQGNKTNIEARCEHFEWIVWKK